MYAYTVYFLVSAIQHFATNTVSTRPLSCFCYRLSLKAYKPLCQAKPFIGQTLIFGEKPAAKMRKMCFCVYKWKKTELIPSSENYEVCKIRFFKTNN